MTQLICCVLSFQVFLSALQAGCNKNSSFPKDFTSNILASVDNEIFNKLRLVIAVVYVLKDEIIWLYGYQYTQIYSFD